MFAAADGLHYQYNVNFPASELNEDNLVGEEYGEIYVGARFLDPSGKTLSLVESDRINHSF
jgi:hypothetical protein